MIPIAMAELEANHWATAAELTDTVAIATMAPGPVGVNLAVGLGYKVAGIEGAIASFLGIVIPIMILLNLVALFFFKAYKHPTVSAAFYGLRPVITGIIIYAGISLAIKNNILIADPTKIMPNGYHLMMSGIHIIEIKSFILFSIVCAFLVKTKVTPIVLIVISGVVGMLLF